MRLLTIILITSLLAACGSSKPVHTHGHRADSVHTRIVERLRQDTVRLPGNVVTVVQQVPCDTAAKHSATPADTARSGHVRLIITNLGGGKQRIDCQADSLIAVIAAKDTEIATYQGQQHTEVRTITVQVLKYRVPLWCYIVIPLLASIAFRKQLATLVRWVAKFIKP